METMYNPIELFKKHATAASFHYADDSCGEWGAARASENKAMQIYHANPEHQQEMNKIGRSQLWARDFAKRAKLDA